MTLNEQAIHPKMTKTDRRSEPDRPSTDDHHWYF
jgi:hypothetical protein